MNRTNWEHALIGALIMLIAWPLFALLGIPGAPFIGLAIAVTWFVSRECTQHEYKIGILRGWKWGQTLPVRWWEGVVRGWSRDSALDCLTPALVCLVLLYALQIGLPLLL